LSRSRYFPNLIGSALVMVVIPRLVMFCKYYALVSAHRSRRFAGLLGSSPALHETRCPGREKDGLHRRPGQAGRKEVGLKYRGTSGPRQRVGVVGPLQGLVILKIPRQNVALSCRFSYHEGTARRPRRSSPIAPTLLREGTSTAGYSFSGHNPPMLGFAC